MEDFDAATVIERLRAKAKSAEEVEQFEAAEQIDETKRIDQVLQAFGVPRRIRMTLTAPVETSALARVREWLAKGEASWCIVLSSDKGVGKSTAAGWWLSRVADGVMPDARMFRRWWPSAEIASMDFYGDDFKRLCECESLVIDDLGVEFNDAKGAFQSKLDRLLDSRYREFRRTIITTNLTAKGFSERYDGRIFDRLREGAQWQSVAGASLRRTG